MRLPYFYPRSPRGERPSAAIYPFLAGKISIHAPREGSDRRACLHLVDVHLISIHAPREGSDYRSSHWGPRSSMISIHAPREGSDRRALYVEPFHNISIHAPREGSDIVGM